MSRSLLFSAAVLSCVSALSTQSFALSDRAITYTSSVQNVTADNRLSPYLVIVHKAGTQIFDVGAAATAGLQQLAETGATDMIQAELAQNPNVISVSKVEGMPLIGAESRSLAFSVDDQSVKGGALVTVLAMIGRSNDSFISVSGLPLKSIGKAVYSIKADNFDAGTEENTGNTEDLNATGHPVAAAEGHISYDRGLNPNGNAPETFRWGSVAAKVSFNKN